MLLVTSGCCAKPAPTSMTNAARPDTVRRWRDTQTVSAKANCFSDATTSLPKLKGLLLMGGTIVPATAVYTLCIIRHT